MVYTGHTAVNRLVAAHNSDLLSPNLRSRAIFVAISIVKSETRDVELYAQLLSSITVPVDAQAYDGVSGITTEQDGTSDGAWVEETEEAVQKEETKLHAEMRNYSTNLIKESIRVSEYLVLIIAIRSCFLNHNANTAYPSHASRASKTLRSVGCRHSLLH